MTLQPQYAATVGPGLTIADPIGRTGDGGTPRGISVPIGYAGTLTTRTDANAGTVALDAIGGIVTDEAVDIYWDGGVQYNVVVGTVAGASVPFDSGIGDDLPIATTAVVVSPRVQVVADIDGDDLQLLALRQHYSQSNEMAASHVDFQDSGSAEIAEFDLAANVPQIWDIAGGADNPLTGNPIMAFYVSNGSVTNAATFQLLLSIVDSTP